MALVMTLFLLVLLSVTGLLFLSIQTTQRDETHQLMQAEKARQLAHAGLEDARQKLTQNYAFFDTLADGQQVFTYVERVSDVGEESPGGFEVTVDLRQSKRPFFLVQVSSVGMVGDLGRPAAMRRLMQEIDVSPWDRSDTSLSNPDLFRVLWSQDLGGQ